MSNEALLQEAIALRADSVVLKTMAVSMGKAAAKIISALQGDKKPRKETRAEAAYRITMEKGQKRSMNRRAKAAAKSSNL